MDCFYNLSQPRNNRDVIPTPLLFRSLPRCHLTQIRQWRLGCGSAYLCIERGERAIFWPPDALQKRSSWQSSSHQSTVVTLSMFLMTHSGGRLLGGKNKFAHPDSTPPIPPLALERWAEEGGDLRDRLILWRGHSKASRKPEGWGGSIWRLSFIYLGGHAAPGVLPGQWWRGRDNDLLVLQISSFLPLPPCSPLSPLLSPSDTLTL